MRRQSLLSDDGGGVYDDGGTNRLPSKQANGMMHPTSPYNTHFLFFFVFEFELPTNIASHR